VGSAYQLGRTSLGVRRNGWSIQLNQAEAIHQNLAIDHGQPYVGSSRREG
jgi:hypothetical protein